MRPLLWLVVGQLLVGLAARVDGVDYLPDPLGWAMGTVALLRVERHGAFVVAAVAAGVAAIVAVPDAVGATTVPRRA